MVLSQDCSKHSTILYIVENSETIYAAAYKKTNIFKTKEHNEQYG